MNVKLPVINAVGQRQTREPHADGSGSGGGTVKNVDKVNEEKKTEKKREKNVSCFSFLSLWYAFLYNGRALNMCFHKIQ